MIRLLFVVLAVVLARSVIRRAVTTRSDEWHSLEPEPARDKPGPEQEPAPVSAQAPETVPVETQPARSAETAGTEDQPPAEDDLRQISGVGPAMEEALHAEGITSFRQLALLDDDAVDDLHERQPRVATALRQGDWRAQARQLHTETHGGQP